MSYEITCPLNTCKNVTFCCQLCRGVLCLVSCKMKCHDIFPHIIWTYLDISGQKWTMAPATVVPLHRQSGTTCRRGKIYSSAEEKLLLGGAAGNRPRPPSVRV